MIECHVCGAKGGPAPRGVSLYRVNETGVKGIWACRKHVGTNAPPDVLEMVDELQAMSTMGLTPRQAGELLGAKVVE
jgi:hypothetical protein